MDISVRNKIVKILSNFILVPSLRRKFRRALYLSLITQKYKCRPVFKKVVKPDVSIVMPVYNQFKMTYDCLKSMAYHMPNVTFEIIVADDGSTDETTKLMDYVDGVEVVRSAGGLGFLKNVKNAMSRVSGKYVFLMNNDMLVTPNWLDALYNTISANESIGIVGSLVLNIDGTVQEYGSCLDRDANPSFDYKVDKTIDKLTLKEVDYCSGCSIMFLKSDWDKLGGFDERFSPAYYEDTDFNYQIKYILGKKIFCQPESKIYHIKNLTYSRKVNKLVETNSKKFKEKWSYILETR